MVIAILLVITGVVMFFSTMGVLPPTEFDIYWPILVVVLGLAMMVKKFGHRYIKQ